jgi:hypothetical protein
MKQSTTPTKETKSMSETANPTNDPYREFEIVRPAEPPRANVGDIELLSQTIAIRIWAFRSRHDLATVLSDGFFDGLRDVRLRKNDRIEVIASWDQPLAEHAVLCVDQIDAATGNAKVSLMLLYERVA